MLSITRQMGKKLCVIVVRPKSIHQRISTHIIVSVHLSVLFNQPVLDKFCEWTSVVGKVSLEVFKHNNREVIGWHFFLINFTTFNYYF